MLAKLPISDFQNPSLIVFSASTLHIHLAIECLFYLFLLVLRLLAGQVLSWLGCRAPQDHVDSLPQSSYPSSPLNDQDSTLRGLHHFVAHTSHRMQKHKLGVTCPSAFFYVNRTGPTEA
jgi:hypothetical protein